MSCSFFSPRGLYVNHRAGMASPGPHISEQPLAGRKGCGCEMDGAAGPKGAAGGGCSHLHSFWSIPSWRKIRAAAATLEMCFHSERIPLLSRGCNLETGVWGSNSERSRGGKSDTLNISAQGICLFVHSFIHQPVLREGLLCARDWDLSTRIWVWPGQFKPGLVNSSLARSLWSCTPAEQEGSALQWKSMAACSSTLAWRIPWTEEPGGLQSMGSQRVRHNWVSNTVTLNRDKITSSEMPDSSETLKIEQFPSPFPAKFVCLFVFSLQVPGKLYIIY